MCWGTVGLAGLPAVYALTQQLELANGEDDVLSRVDLDRLGSGVRVSASFQIFALTAEENVLYGRTMRGGDVRGGNISGGQCHSLVCYQ